VQSQSEYILCKVDRIRGCKILEAVFESVEHAFGSVGISKWQSSGDRHRSLDTKSGDPTQNESEYFFEVTEDLSIPIERKASGRLQITEGQRFSGDEKHYLYHLVPRSIEIKVHKMLAAGNPVILPAGARIEAIDDLLADGDILLYPDKKNFDRAKKIYNELTDIIAILAFVPDGIEIFGYRYEVVGGTQ
jgi:hypothetical protein